MEHTLPLFIFYLSFPFEAALDVSFIPLLPPLIHLTLSHPSPIVPASLLIYLFALPIEGALLR